MAESDSAPSGFSFRYFLFLLIFGLFLVEGTIRILYKDKLDLYFHPDERTVLYQFDDKFGWYPVPLVSQLFHGSVPFEVSHNSHGFRDKEWDLQTTKKRLMVLGDSFVWGYDVQQHERFTELIKKNTPDWEVYNLGVSGYGTDQEYMLLLQMFDMIQPDLVLLVHCANNDTRNNCHNIEYNKYYKPYFESNGSSLSLQGVPVRQSKIYKRKDSKLLKLYIFKALIYRASQRGNGEKLCRGG